MQPSAPPSSPAPAASSSSSALPTGNSKTDGNDDETGSVGSVDSAERARRRAEASRDRQRAHDADDARRYGGFHRRWVSADGDLLQEPDNVPCPKLRPAHRPATSSVAHGVFAVYNNHAGEDAQVRANGRMLEGTFGGGRYLLHHAAFTGNLGAARTLLGRYEPPAEGKRNPRVATRGTDDDDGNKGTNRTKPGAFRVDVAVTDHLRDRTALHVACACGHKEIVDVLLAAGAHRDAQDQWGWTPLMYAVHAGHERLVRYLVSRCGCLVSSVGKVGAGADAEGATAYSLTLVEHRGRALQRAALTDFIRTTEDDLTAQSAANGWRCTFGPLVHRTRPPPRHRKVTATFALDGSRLVLKYRSGEFGLQWTTRILDLHRLGWPLDAKTGREVVYAGPPKRLRRQSRSRRWLPAALGGGDGAGKKMDGDVAAARQLAQRREWELSKPVAIEFEEAVASAPAAAAAVAGHVRGYGKTIEPWMRLCEKGRPVVALVCRGGIAIERTEAEEENAGHLDAETSPTAKRGGGGDGGGVQGMVVGRRVPVPGPVRLELPVPRGIHVSFMLRYLRKLEETGRAAAAAAFAREETERADMHKPKPGVLGVVGATLKRMSTRALLKRDGSTAASSTMMFKK